MELTEKQHEIRCERLAKASESAQNAFWEEFIRNYPEANTDNLDNTDCEIFDRACAEVTAEWVDNNVPEWQDDIQYTEERDRVP